MSKPLYWQAKTRLASGALPLGPHTASGPRTGDIRQLSSPIDALFKLNESLGLYHFMICCVVSYKIYHSWKRGC